MPIQAFLELSTVTGSTARAYFRTLTMVCIVTCTVAPYSLLKYIVVNIVALKYNDVYSFCLSNA
jgi:hypothetical protein